MNRARRYIWPVLTLLSLFALYIGVDRGEFGVVNRWAHTLCTSCIGLGR